jgi:hypothetical protein
MAELSPEARALVSDGRGIFRPTVSDRARVAGLLATRLGEAAVLAPAEAFASPSQAMAWQKIASVIGIGVVAAGAAYWFTRAPAETTAHVAPVPSTLAVAMPDPLPQVEEERALAPEPPHASVPAPSAVVPAPKKAENLTEELAILSKAATELRAGRASAALRLLDEHRRKFPTGRLVEERRAARVQALCALGNRAEAEAELARLVRTSPRSPHVARAQRACGL